VAEYSGLARALAFLTEFTSGLIELTAVTIRSDSQLVVEQVNRRWKIRDQNLKAICAECQQHLQTLISRGHSVILEHIRREDNREADRLCNQALDAVLR
jgi:ribonuclease HI